MKLLPIVLVLLILIFLAVVVAKKLGRLPSNSMVGPAIWPFYVKKLLTPPEQILYQRLVKALPEQIVLAQVQVSRVLGVKKGWRFHEWNNRINRLTYDFVVCTQDSTVIAAIELDDPSHEKESRRITDEKKNKASVNAGLRLIRWHVRSIPDEQAIRQELLPSQTSEPKHKPILKT